MLDIEAPNVDSARMRRAGKELLSLALMDSRNHTLRWIAAYERALGAAAMQVPQQPELSPPLWELGHAGWFQERWIARNVQRQRGARCDPSQPRLASILAEADRCFDDAQVGHAQRWTLALPELQAIRQYLVDTLETTLELLDNSPDDDDEALYFYRLALFHEDMLGEKFAHMSQTLGFDAGLLGSPAAVNAREPLLFPATVWPMGCEPGGFVFDNEKWVHDVPIPEFEIDAQPVSWGQYAEFVEDGGYDRSELWHPQGWELLQREGRRCPRHVDQIRHGVLQQRLGRLTRVPQAQPALHVGWYEADAWCRWAGRRLPAEPEWEAAAHLGASRGFRWGDVWEWTASSFEPYRGFAPGPQRDYSQPAFGTHKVLRGASFATRGRMRSAKFRAFALPEADHLFCGFRSCAL
ncbi:selenoneine synthase SenA [Piscinibacter defluvii]|uniref:selenoneine synthase SenA n=1 Tax=Piscinibacter defluvii TaxID=1796922 RepID=UPI002872D70A|nr:selenoneine synthase SenA [Piscinibacter defluvii]